MSRVIAILCITVFLIGSTGFAQTGDPKTPWAVLPKAQSLDNGRKTALLEELERQQNYGECKGTVLDCLLQERPDRVAVRNANFAAYLVSKGVPPRGLGKFFSRRAEFAQSAEIHQFHCQGAPIYGDEKAGISLIEFAEFKCPMCGRMSPILKKLIDESGGTVRLCFKHFPILSHQGTMLASTGAVAEQRQGKFWEMVALLYEDMKESDENHVFQDASYLGLDMERFKADLADPEVEKIVRADKVEGVAANVDATPTLFINGKRHNLPMDEVHLKDTINAEAERLGIAPPYKDWIYP